MTDPIVGIDLGTTYSLIAHINSAGRPEVVPSLEGDAGVPSVVYFGENPPLVGKPAKELQASGATDVAAFFKRRMGDSQFSLNMGGREWSPIDLSALVLRSLKEHAEAALGTSIASAVVTVPAYFHNQQREATIEAGRRAGLEVRKIINEPTAAALAYGFHSRSEHGRVLIYDLGGGTFDVSLVEISAEEIRVLAIAGDHNLGGKDWDDRVATYLAERFARVHGADPLDDNISFHELLTRAETAKKGLSVRDRVSVVVQHGGHRETFELTRPILEDLTRGLLERTQQLVEQVLDGTRLGWNDLAGVLLVGGSTRMRMVHDYVARMSGKPSMGGVNVDEAVALGAAIQAALDRGVDDASSRLGLPSAGRKSPRFFLAGKQAVRDVTAHSLGMVAVSSDGERYVNSVILPKNSAIPTAVARPYQLATRRGKMNELDVYMTQGESDDPSACLLLGRYHFQEISGGQGGAAVLDVHYAYDQNTVVRVSAVEKSTGRCLPMNVEPLPDDMSWLHRSPKEHTAVTQLTAYLAFDVSGSMSGRPLDEAKRAAHEFNSKLDLAHSSVGVVSFADSVLTNIPASQDVQVLHGAITSLKVGLGYGNMATPFAHIHRLLRDATGLKAIVVLTDGVWDCQRKAIKEAKRCAADNILIIAIGFGAADRAFLGQIATSEQGSIFTQCEKLVDTFGTIGQELAESVADPSKSKYGLRRS